ncbi:MAG: GNAT family N-acetyltransferase [Lachnospiraceae bacterium]|nr:GNAT family N-acetyltransferase [Lachnospiraceae bacterium]
MDDKYTVSVVEPEDYIQFEDIVPKEITDSADIVIAAFDEEDNTVAVLISEKTSDNMLNVSYILVDSDVRGHGIGKEMMRALRAMGIMEGVDGIECSFPGSNGWEDIKGFMSALGFVSENTVDDIYCFRISDINAMMDNYKKKHVSSRIVSLNDLPNSRWLKYRQYLLNLKEVQKKNYKNSSKDTENWIYPDIGSMDSYKKDISMVALEDDRDRVVCILLSEYEDGLLIRYACSTDSAAMMTFFAVISNAFDKIREIYKQDTKIYVNASNVTIQKLIRNITEDNFEKINERKRYVSYI